MFEEVHEIIISDGNKVWSSNLNPSTHNHNNNNIINVDNSNILNNNGFKTTSIRFMNKNLKELNANLDDTIESPNEYNNEYDITQEYQQNHHHHHKKQQENHKHEENNHIALHALHPNQTISPIIVYSTSTIITMTSSFYDQSFSVSKDNDNDFDKFTTSSTLNMFENMKKNNTTSTVTDTITTLMGERDVELNVKYETT